MKAKITVAESLKEYFETIQRNMDENLDKQLRLMARELVGDEEDPSDGFIAPLMSSKFNPNLYISGQEDEFWQVDFSEGINQIIMVYTGMRLHENYDNPKVWWEFANEWGRLARDYAYYQETQSDHIAKPEGAKHPFAVERGVLASRDKMFEMTINFVENILKEGSGYFFMPK